MKILFTQTSCAKEIEIGVSFSRLHRPTEGRRKKTIQNPAGRRFFGKVFTRFGNHEAFTRTRIGKRIGHSRSRGIQIFLSMNGGNEERFRSIVKTLPSSSILRKGFPCIKVNVQKMPHRSGIFTSIEAPQDGRTWLNTIFAGCCPEGILGPLQK